MWVIAWVSVVDDDNDVQSMESVPVKNHGWYTSTVSAVWRGRMWRLERIVPETAERLRMYQRLRRGYSWPFGTYVEATSSRTAVCACKKTNKGECVTHTGSGGQPVYYEVGTNTQNDTPR